ncbi:MAG TPA: hypothetical protein VEG38_19345 [Acidimicrobiia bacterium]|nr:hypothetical protein [Acidimicrobiia bacterium]
MRPSPSVPARRRPLARSLGLALAVSLVLAACGDGDKKEAGTADTTATTAASGPDKVSGSVASYDLAVGPAGRFMFGMFNEAKGPIGFGTAQFSFFFLGTNSGNETQEPGPTVTATYLPLPGSDVPAGDASKPQYLPTDQRGVYAANVAFHKPGFWGVAAVVDLDGRQEVKSAFKVLPKHEVPAVGDPAPASQNLVVNSPGAPPEAIDSRASANSPVPDPELHQTTVAQALAEKRPVVLIVSTPTYCVSLFCGPITDMAAELAKTYSNKARFIHIEVWKDYKAQQLNDAAKEWIARGESINEPWAFVIGADGKISHRFDNIVAKSDLEPILQQLPPMKA